MRTQTRSTRTTRSRTTRGTKTSRTTKAKQIKLKSKTGLVWTTGNRNTIRQLTKSTTPATVTYRRLKGLVTAFQTQAKRKGISLAKANGRGRH